jgi:hypothetical protein
LAHPARRGGVTRPYVRLRASARAVRSDCRAPMAHGEARWSLASDVVVVAIAGSGSAERRLSASLQRFSSDSPASCRSVRRVKQTWIRGATRECTGAAIVLGAQELNRPGDPYTARRRNTRFVTANATSPSENSARQAMRAPGTAEEMWLLMGRGVHDTRREPVGGFAEPVAPNDLVGSYANRRRERRRGCGSFGGDADDERQGLSRGHDGVVIPLRLTQPTTGDADLGAPTPNNQPQGSAGTVR